MTSAELAGQRRNSSPLFHRAKYSISSPPASVEPRSLAANRVTKIRSRRCRRAACCEPFWVRSAIGIRLIASFPPAGPAHLDTRLLKREPRDPGLPFRPLPGRSVGPRGGQQKTLRSGRLGRVREKRTVNLAVRQDRSHEPGMRNRIAWGYSACGQFFRSGTTSLGSWCLSQTEVSARARDIRPQLADVKRDARGN